jgi:hypothetical protein
MNHPIHLSDIVALTQDLPERRLWRGQVGTVVELLAPDAFEVEFCDDEGRTYASLGPSHRSTYGAALSAAPNGLRTQSSLAEEIGIRMLPWHIYTGKEPVSPKSGSHD